MNRAVSRLLDLLFPPKCPLCRRLVPRDGELCASCRESLPRRKNPEVQVEFVDKCVSPLSYTGTVAEALRRMKFSNLPGYAKSFGRLLAETVGEALAGEYDLVSWVPVSPRRRRRRGYDQAQLLAREVGRELGVPVVSTLCKPKDNPAQSGVGGPAARKANVLGVYIITDSERVLGQRILLIDDIVTTGATLAECAMTLKAAGAARVVAAAVAHGDK